MRRCLRNRGTVIPWMAVLFFAFSVGDAYGGANRRRMKIDFYQAKGATAYDAKDWPTAVKYYEYVHRLMPYDGGSAYNLACCYALNGQKPEAIQALDAAITYGWDDPEWIQRDPDLATLEGEAKLAGLLDRASQCRAEKRVVYVPPQLPAGEAAPLIVALHGFGGNAREFSAHWREAADALGVVVVAPRGVAPAGPRQQLNYGWHAGQQPGKLDIPATTQAVDEAIEAARQAAKIDEERIVLAGFSQGASAALLVYHAHPERFRGVVTLGESYAVPEDGSWAIAAGGSPLRICLVVGEADRTLGINTLNNTLLSGLNHKVQMIKLPVIAHEIPDDHGASMKRAVSFVLGK